MRTRRAIYPSPNEEITMSIGTCPQKRRLSSSAVISSRTKKPYGVNDSPFDALHDDLLISIMVAVSSSANSPADLVNAKLTCKRFFSAAMHQKVLTHTTMAALAVKASKWGDESHRFLKQCADAGNPGACYMLGMIRFYCLMNRGSGVALMAEAAIASHPSALYSLAVIQFNGSGGSRKDKVLKAGVVLCAKAAAVGHVDAMRELGHCLQDGYGVKKNAEEGRKLLLEANAREAAAAREAISICVSKNSIKPQSKTNSSVGHRTQKELINCRKAGSSGSSEGNHRQQHCVQRLVDGGSGSLLSDFGCDLLPAAKTHVINDFLVEWFTLHPPTAGLRLCSHSKCGRPETRRHEFRRCSACGSVNYCSRACQALDWKMKHRYHCNPVENWDERQDLDIVDQDDGDDHNANDHDHMDES
eukprot:Gb_29240 [translate_table: standard]